MYQDKPSASGGYICRTPKEDRIHNRNKCLRGNDSNHFSTVISPGSSSFLVFRVLISIQFLFSHITSVRLNLPIFRIINFFFRHFLHLLFSISIIIFIFIFLHSSFKWHSSVYYCLLHVFFLGFFVLVRHVFPRLLPLGVFAYSWSFINLPFVRASLSHLV